MEKRSCKLGQYENRRSLGTLVEELLLNICEDTKHQIHLKHFWVKGTL